jgi:ribosomal protein S18 acetylase RimI-like enzyme
MTVFSDPHISLASSADVPALVALMNSAYRGESSKKGWTTEAHLIDGDVRTDEADVLGVLSLPGSVFLAYRDDEGALIGCVNLQRKGERIYLGMFSVSPELQGGGLGKKLMAAAEEYAKAEGVRAIYMSVISVREDLIAWYQRRGYADTGERIPFPEDGRTGPHLQDLEFMVLEKDI